MNRFVLDANLLLGLKEVVSKDKVTVYDLDRIHVEIDRQMAYLVASNGHMLVVARKMFAEDVVEAPVSFYISPDLLKGLNKKHFPLFKIEEDYIAMEYGMPLVEQLIRRNKDQEAYPDWRAILRSPCFKENPSGIAAQFNPEYLAKLVKARNLINDVKKGNSFLSVRYNGAANPTYVDMQNEDVIAIVMPFRDDSINLMMPMWAMEI